MLLKIYGIRDVSFFLFVVKGKFAESYLNLKTGKQKNLYLFMHFKHIKQDKSVKKLKHFLKI